MTEPLRVFPPNNPNLKPPDEIRLESLAVEPMPDGRRVKVQIEMTPFRDQPNIELALLDEAGRPAGGTTVIGAMNFRLALTLHLRGEVQPGGAYRARATLYYDDPSTPVHRVETAFRLPSAAS